MRYISLLFLSLGQLIQARVEVLQPLTNAQGLSQLVVIPTGLVQVSDRSLILQSTCV